MNDAMNCVDIEILLAEYVDGTLPETARAKVERHLESCEACRELAQDAAAAVEFIGHSAAVDAPPELVTGILFQVSSHAALRPPLAQRLFGKILGGWLQPVFETRWAMGMATTALFFSIVGVHVRELRPADLNPAKVWTNTENRVGRSWERGVKYYENLRLVFEIQTQLEQWNEEATAAPQDAQPGGSK